MDGTCGGAEQKARVLFVDDESSILDGLRNLLRRDRKRWDMVFAQSGAEALAEFEKQPFDIVISDMRMPGMDGATLLGHVKSQYPSAARLVLSGHAEKEAVMRALPVAQQFLSKPCDAVVLRYVIERTCDPVRASRDRALRELVGSLSSLPSFPRTYWELSEAAQKADVGMTELAKIVQQDGPMTAKVLQLVNSSYFGVAKRITSVQQAVSYLGVGLLKGLALSAQVFGTPGDGSRNGLDVERLQNHSVLVARIARKLVVDPALAEEAFATGLVHDLGKVVFATGMGEQYASVVDSFEAGDRELHELELASFGASHADVGSFLLGTWGLPFSMVHAVALHHEPSLAPEGSDTELLAALHIANAAAHALGNGEAAFDAHIDQPFIRRAELQARWPQLRQIALQELERAADN